MKLVKLFSNNPDRFKPIVFNQGLNVIFAQVSRPKDSSVDSHNLGKTLLIDVLDYCLLKEIDKHHFTRRFPVEFRGLDFFLQVLTVNNEYVTIKRPIDPNTKISLYISKDKDSSPFESGSTWTHDEVAIGKAKDILDALFDLRDIKPFDFRMGLTYFLRKQRDYLDVFQIEKFSAGKHSVWKPYIAKVLGLEAQVIRKKYELEERSQEKESQKLALLNNVTLPFSQYDEIKARIELKRTELQEVTSKLDEFSFADIDLADHQKLVKDVESLLLDLNNRLYSLNFEIENIERSLQQKIVFKLNDVEKLFNEMKLYFPENLKKDYKELLDFNEKISKDRFKRLHDRKSSVMSEIASIEISFKEKNAEREKILASLKEQETFAKYKKMYSKIVEEQADLSMLESQLKRLEEVQSIERELRELEGQKKTAISHIDEELKKENVVLSTVRLEFSRIIKHVLNLPALLYIQQNSEGNLEFEAQYTVSDKATSPTAESNGTTYKKMLCVAFDLALLNHNKNSKFYHFVYHDGVFEGLDNRKKVKLLEIIRDYVSKRNIQYILSVIDTDLPRNEDDTKVYFEDSEVVRTLNDSGDSGRLFIGPKF